MIARSSLRKGWCPGALRPMESGDGLILRIRPRVGTLPISALSTIAKTAAEFGSGEIDLTNRGNLQLRGLTAASHSQALADLGDAGLIDADERAEAVRNIIVDPLSGIDPARTDIRSLTGRLENILIEDRTFWQLPGKFGFSFSGTAEARVGDRSTDIMVSSIAPETYAVSLDGNIEVGALLPPHRVVEAVTGLTAVFLELRASDLAIGRMKDAVARSGSATIYAAAGLESTKLAATEIDAVSLPPAGSLNHRGQVFAAGVGLPFGRIDAHQLGALYAVASNAGTDVVRMSPQRVLVFPVDDDTKRDNILTEAKRQGLITEPDDPRLLFDVCPGSPACANATTETRRDARRIADAVRGRPSLPSIHVSGCEKGCARRGAAALTLVARDGRYDVICNDDPAGPVALAAVSPAEIDSAVARFILEHAR
ncbi:precorrin-3B synthase [Hyphomicrobium denitrificans 1NES1]|uniref:Precorrin-3B synthase n=1 Tax=Hyphomicrobium denitrificans 1NES1 TaxID=670307 RepID=N0BA23_9HYPH|nr:precorrin-3B synthase [Hyphomicrobium denitrificans]AGK59097.1 precorrin-3B synthase [Hyphomicrobium denitrificans 1NES1]